MTKERGIIFTGESVRAILAGAKTQTRRVIKPQPHQRESGYWWFGQECFASNARLVGEVMEGYCPYGLDGDGLWVRETWGFSAKLPASTRDEMSWLAYPELRAYRANNPEGDWCWRSPLYMPRWASRITLEIVSVRVERVQDISDDDAIEEGVDRTNTSIPTYARQRFQKLWDSINGERAGCAWADNPWVWALEFRRVTP